MSAQIGAAYQLLFLITWANENRKESKRSLSGYYVWALAPDAATHTRASEETQRQKASPGVSAFPAHPLNPQNKRSLWGFSIEKMKG